MTITSSTTLRNDYAKISAMAHASDEPIYITKNGEGDIAVLSIEALERRDEMIRLKAHLDAVEEGRLEGTQGISVEEARKRLMEKYKNAGL
ncbi:type II toxin-antitoxin system Phd/YefM family antitoxin [Ruminococcus champanellensis]|uniref:type II toxin-antitoxin system Phd/YefM family antitoxin n=1 Tax=Ruminococcus champanellensis TaxID=1161942 RepID=UPI0023F003C0|nr:type II toxin-antitoxin system Phd/YefM family antitoxin [Ruminococcus champanellensis]